MASRKLQMATTEGKSLDELVAMRMAGIEEEVRSGLIKCRVEGLEEHLDALTRKVEYLCNSLEGERRVRAAVEKLCGARDDKADAAQNHTKAIICEMLDALKTAFPEMQDRWNGIKRVLKIPEEVSPRLKEELAGDESPEFVRERIHALVRQELGVSATAPKESEISIRPTQDRLDEFYALCRARQRSQADEDMLYWAHCITAKNGESPVCFKDETPEVAVQRSKATVAHKRSRAACDHPNSQAEQLHILMWRLGAHLFTIDEAADQLAAGISERHDYRVRALEIYLAQSCRRHDIDAVWAGTENVGPWPISIARPELDGKNCLVALYSALPPSAAPPPDGLIQ